MADVKTTIVVNFSAANANGGSSLSAEIDSRPTGLNAGRTSFAPGDAVGILVYRSDDVILDSYLSSAGSVSDLGDRIVAVDEYVNFSGEAEVNLSKPYYGGASYSWIGANLGGITFAGSRATVVAPGVGIARVQYNTRARAITLNSPTTVSGLTTFPILVVINGHNDLPS